MKKASELWKPIALILITMIVTVAVSRSTIEPRLRKVEDTQLGVSFQLQRIEEKLDKIQETLDSKSRNGG